MAVARRAHLSLLLGLSLGCTAISSAASAEEQAAFAANQRDFLDGMVSYSAGDFRRAEEMFRGILDRDPRLLRVRLELARALYMQNEDEQADYHFGLAATGHPPALVMRNILRFREAIRARRSWRLNFDIGFAPDSNVNSATDKDTIDIHGLPFRLDPDARAHSGVGRFVGADASIRVNRSGEIPVYLGAYGRWTRYGDHRFDDAYAGAEAGPEFQLKGGRMRLTATGLMRWYGKRPLVTSLGARASFEKLVGDAWTVDASALVRHNDYAGRSDVDGWDLEAGASASRPLGSTTLGFVHATVGRTWADDRGQAFWRGRVGIGVFKEIGWGLRPQLGVDFARQVNDAPMAPFGQKRRDWQLQGSFSIYKRDWNVNGFAPSLHLSIRRNRSTIPLYDEQRTRGEVRITRAF